MDPSGSDLESSLPQPEIPCLIVEDSQPDSAALEDDPDSSYRALLARRLSSLQPTSHSPVLVNMLFDHLTQHWSDLVYVTIKLSMIDRMSATSVCRKQERREGQPAQGLGQQLREKVLLRLKGLVIASCIQRL